MNMTTTSPTGTAITDLAHLGFRTDVVIAVKVDAAGLQIDYEDRLSVVLSDEAVDVLEDGHSCGIADRFCVEMLALRLGIEDPEHAAQDLSVLHRLLLHPDVQTPGQGELLGRGRLASKVSDGFYDRAILKEQVRLTRNDGYRRDLRLLEAALDKWEDRYDSISKADAENDVRIARRLHEEDDPRSQEDLDEALEILHHVEGIGELQDRIASRRAKLFELRRQRALPEDERINPNTIRIDGTTRGS